MMMAALQHAARALGGDVVAGQILCPGPGHSPRDRSLSVRFDNRAPDGFLVTSFSGDDWKLCRDYVRERLGLAESIGIPPNSAQRRKPAPTTVSKRNSVLAPEIWREACAPAGTPAELYLARRGLEMPAGAASDALRYHPACPFKNQRTPALVALVRDVLTNEPKAIHRTAITGDGFKAKIDGLSRLSLGPVGDGAVKLTPDEDTTTCLGIGEGIETTLSLRLAPELGASPVWALLSAGQIAAFPVLAGIECLWIAVDHDPAGVKAANITAVRWRDAGREVFLVRPNTERVDLNDLAGAA